MAVWQLSGYILLTIIWSLGPISFVYGLKTKKEDWMALGFGTTIAVLLATTIFGYLFSLPVNVS